VVIYYEEEEVTRKEVPKKVYVIINDEKHYIDPEIVKKYNLDELEVTCLTGRKLYVEKA
jgi:hypothetical protein